MDLLFDDFASNVATLPIDDASVFIRSVSSRFGYSGPYLWTDGRASGLDPMRPFVRDFQARPDPDLLRCERKVPIRLLECQVQVAQRGCGGQPGAKGREHEDQTSGVARGGGGGASCVDRADGAAAAALADLPARLADAEFWKLIEEFSEPNGTFRSDNLLSNEIWFQTIIPELVTVVKPGAVYMGVGPEQNFSYIAALKPRVVFIVDIRRGNLHTQLMYKALFELARDRADFVSMLFARKRPEGLTPTLVGGTTFSRPSPPRRRPRSCTPNTIARWSIT